MEEEKQGKRRKDVKERGGGEGAYDVKRMGPDENPHGIPGYRGGSGPLLSLRSSLINAPPQMETQGPEGIEG